ncbi:MAG: biopolymer transporter ExbD [Bacteroidia bacterium]|nr:biopolymer transporter ExbD [Bacteroidia bacterium]
MAKKTREVQEINASSMADIAFLLLVFFLVTTTFDSDYAIERRLPAKLKQEIPPEDVKIEARNVFILLINKQDELFVNGERGDMKKLKDDVKTFILNPTNDPRLSEKSQKFVQSPLLKAGKYYKSKGVITLQGDRLTSYRKYIAVQGILTAAFEEMRDEVADREFQMTYAELKEKASKGNDEIAKKKFAERVDAIDDLLPMAISEAETRKSAVK